jgi:hypothetical protein
MFIDSSELMFDRYLTSIFYDDFMLYLVSWFEVVFKVDQKVTIIESKQEDLNAWYVCGEAIEGWSYNVITILRLPKVKFE